MHIHNTHTHTQGKKRASISWASGHQRMASSCPMAFLQLTNRNQTDSLDMRCHTKPVTARDRKHSLKEKARANLNEAPNSARSFCFP